MIKKSNVFNDACYLDEAEFAKMEDRENDVCFS